MKTGPWSHLSRQSVCPTYPIPNYYNCIPITIKENKLYITTGDGDQSYVIEDGYSYNGSWSCVIKNNTTCKGSSGTAFILFKTQIDIKLDTIVKATLRSIDSNYATGIFMRLIKGSDDLITSAAYFDTNGNDNSDWIKLIMSFDSLKEMISGSNWQIIGIGIIVIPKNWSIAEKSGFQAINKLYENTDDEYNHFNETHNRVLSPNNNNNSNNIAYLSELACCNRTQFMSIPNLLQFHPIIENVYSSSDKKLLEFVLRWDKIDFELNHIDRIEVFYRIITENNENDIPELLFAGISYCDRYHFSKIAIPENILEMVKFEFSLRIVDQVGQDFNPQTFIIPILL